MYYYSTRDLNKTQKYTSAEVIKKGLADDGGLFIPETIPALTENDIKELCSDKYPVRAAKILSKFLTDYTYDELLSDCTEAYSESSFVGGAAPLTNIKENVYTLELWHGPTAAFKDMALQIMPKLLSRALVKTGEKRTALILVATSGDTGKAALEGYKDIPGIKIMVYYPIDGVSRVQKLQMATQTGNNVNVCAIRGNFDDAQNGVKAIFSDGDMAKKLDENGYFLSSANSINWGRLAPQIVYYISAYCDLINEGKLSFGDKMNVCVPTGNFGNIFGAYIAKRMGLPIGTLICASNANNVLTDFFNKGIYDRRRDFHTTISPSMDILISSNFERLLCLAAGSEKTVEYMTMLKTEGVYTVGSEVISAIDKEFKGYFASEEDTKNTIKSTLLGTENLIDTHTAVALFAAEKYRNETKDLATMVVASTASPYKFASDVYASIKDEIPADGLEALNMLVALTGVEIPYPLKGIADRKVRFEEVIDASDMPQKVLEFAK
jgi:threonine synthase